MPGCRLVTDLTYRGLETVVLENGAARIVVLVEKGGDVIEFRDKRTDVNVLFESPHEWRSPAESFVPSSENAWLDHYPGGWQDVLPFAGKDESANGAFYAQHGETALLPWNATVLENSSERVRVRLDVRLTRYPFAVEKTLTLEAGSPTLRVEETVTNESERDLPYLWLQHVALGTPLVEPGARIHVPAETVVTAPEPISPNSRLPGDRTFEWPHVETLDGETVDLSVVPDEPCHDVAYLTDFTDGWYGVQHADLDLGFGFGFDESLYECIWLWQSFGGYEGSPYFDRAWNLGVEPATGYPEANFPDAQRETGTLDILGGGESVTTSYAATTYRDRSELESLTIG